MRSLVPILAAIALSVLSSGCQRAPESPGVTIEDAVVTLPAVPGRPGAAYFTAHTNQGPTRLVAVSGERIGRVALHDSIEDGGTMRMRPIAEPSFSPDMPLRFEPGGKHAMLFGIDPALRIGDRTRLTLRFDSAPPVTVEAEVRGPGDAGHSDH